MLRLVVEFPRQGQLFCSDATHRVFRIGVTGILWKYFVHFNYDEPTEPNPLLSPLGRSGPRATLHMSLSMVLQANSRPPKTLGFP